MRDDLERRLAEGLGERLPAAADQEPLDLLATGVRAFLDACLDRGLTQIALIDAPSVLGWEEWREIDMKYGMGLVSFGLQQAMDRGAIRPQPVRPLAHLMLGALGEAGMVIATAEEPEAARAEVEQAVLALLAGLRA